MKTDPRVIQIRTALGARGELTAAELSKLLDLSQPTISRLLKQLGGDLLRIQGGRSARYGLRRRVRNLPRVLPVFSISTTGEACHVADLTPFATRSWWVDSHNSSIASRSHGDLPYWLDDLRPSGFLGRLAPKQFPELQLPEDLSRWDSDDHVEYLANVGWDTPGNLIIGERALELFDRRSREISQLQRNERTLRYPEIASQMLRYGTPGSSAAGEQPKFLTVIDDRHVLVKFSPPGEGEVARRRKDLLVAENYALEALGRANQSAARSELIVTDDQIFLEVERFDRVALRGRQGVTSLNALDLEFLGSSTSGAPWRMIASGLYESGKISAAIRDEILRRYYFGVCIGNSDMHSGNLSLFTDGERVLGVAPVYDMLPMCYAPVAETPPAYEFSPPRLPPNDSHLWGSVIPIAVEMWDRITGENGVSAEFRAVAREWRDHLRGMRG